MAVSQRLIYCTSSICQGGIIKKSVHLRQHRRWNGVGAEWRVLERWLKCLLLELKDFGALFLLGSRGKSPREIRFPRLIDNSLAFHLLSIRVQSRVISYTKKPSSASWFGFQEKYLKSVTFNRDFRWISFFSKHPRNLSYWHFYY